MVTSNNGRNGTNVVTTTRQRTTRNVGNTATVTVRFTHPRSTGQVTRGGVGRRVVQRPGQCQRNNGNVFTNVQT